MLYHVLCLFLGVVAASTVPCEGPQCGELIYGVWIDGSNVTYVFVNNNPMPYEVSTVFPVGDFKGKKIGDSAVILSQEIVLVAVENSGTSTDLALYDGFKMKLHQFSSVIPFAVDDLKVFSPLPFNTNVQMIIGSGREIYLLNVPKDFSAVKLTKLADLPSAQCAEIVAGTVGASTTKTGGKIYVHCEGHVFVISVVPTIKVDTHKMMLKPGAALNILDVGFDVQLQTLWWFGNYSDADLHPMLSLGNFNLTSPTQAVVTRVEPITAGNTYLKHNMAMDDLNRLAHIMVTYENFDTTTVPLMYSLRIQEQGRVYDFARVKFPPCHTGKCTLTATITP